MNRRWCYAAAAVLLVTVTSAIYLLISERQPKDELVTSESIPPTNIEIIKKTDPGEKLNITLEDSTIIRLNSGSQLRYQEDTYREVSLVDEAFFDVARDTLHPFIIRTADIITTVLGTSFNIRAFAEDESIAVSVVSGEVRVEKEKDTLKQVLQLLPGDQAMYRINDTLLTKGTFEYDDVLSWKEGRLYFKNARFYDIVHTLERWYGVEIEVKRTGIENGFSGSYTNRSLESVLEGMSFVLDFEYEIQNKKIIIR